MLLKDWLLVVSMDTIDFIRVVKNVTSSNAMDLLYLDNEIYTIRVSNSIQFADFINQYGDCKLVYASFINDCGVENDLILSFDMPLYDDNYEEGTDKDFDTHFEDVQNGNGYYDEDGKYRSYGYSDENF